MQKNLNQNLRIREILIKRKKTDYINNTLDMLPIHKELSKLDFKKTK